MEKSPTKLTLTHKQEIVNLYLKEKNLERVRSCFKTSMKTITTTLKEAGITVTMRKQPLDVTYFKEIDSKEKAYWLGFITADGCLHKNKYKLSFGVRDPDILFKFKKAIGAGSPVGHRFVLDKRTGKTNEQYNLQINSKEFCQYIANHGIDQFKSTSFSIPKIEEKYFPHFYRGLFDGDGSITTINSLYRINVISTLNGIKFLKEYLFDTFGWDTQKIFSKRDQGIHYLTTQKHAVDFLEWIYKDSEESCRLDRKYTKYIQARPAYEKRKFKLINTLTGENIETLNLTGLCRQRGFNPNSLLSSRRKNAAAKRGIHAGWLLLPKEC